MATTGNELFDLAGLFPLAARKVLDAATPMDAPYPNEVLPDEETGMDFALNQDASGKHVKR
jgi:hypothetical protein